MKLSDLNALHKHEETNSKIAGGHHHHHGWQFQLARSSLVPLARLFRHVSTQNAYPDQIKSTGFRSITCWLSPYRSRHLGGLWRIISSPTSRTLDRKNGMSEYVKVSSVLWGRILDWVPDWVWTEGGGIKGSFRQLVRPHFKVRLIGGVVFRLRLSVE